MIVTSIDPAGNFKEGKGSTGIVITKYIHRKKWPLIAKVTTIRAKDYQTKAEYYNAILFYIPFSKVVVCESFTLYGSKASALVGSQLETVQLIGIIEQQCNTLGIQFVSQTAAQAKSRWTNQLLLNHRIVEKKGNGFAIRDKMLNRHTLDALRHALLFHIRFKKKGRKAL